MSHLRDFHQTADGGYIYGGSFHVFQGETPEWKRLMGRLAVLTAVCFGGEIVSGCVAAPGAFRCAYVLLPAVIALVAAISVLWGFVRLAAGGTRLRSYVYAATVERLPLRCGLAAVFAGLAMAGEVIYVIRHGMGGLLAGMVVFLACQAAVLVCSLLWIRLLGATRWTLEEKTAP